jgi:glycosyltransferase involved in cell wall biosynthesis
MPPREAVLLVPGSLETLTGGYAYDRRIVLGLRARGWRVDVRELDASFPDPTPAARADAAGALAALPADTLVVVDGLALGVLPDEALRESHRLRLVALVHHPLAKETGLEAVRAQGLEVSERRALGAARLVVVTSRATAVDLAQYGVDSTRIAVVEPGTDHAPLARGSADGSVHLLSVATITPRKNHLALVEALTRLTMDGWTLTCVGSTTRAPACAAAVAARVRAAGLESRVRMVGELGPAALDAEYDRADVFVLPSLHEGFGMAVAEALARGLPVISTPTGGVPDLVDGEAGLLVAPGDVDALADTIARIVRDAGLRRRLAAGARAARARLADWDEAAARMERILDGVQR